MRNKQTKIISTISDINCDPEFIQNLYEAGMDGVRLNTAHASPEGIRNVIKNVRSISRSIPIMLDTKGPEVRTVLEGDPIEVETGDTVYITAPGKDNTDLKNRFTVNYEYFLREIPKKRENIEILIDDGDLSLTLKKHHGSYLELTVNNAGTITNKKSINVPQIPLKLPSLTTKDKEFIALACEEKIDFIAHSFVRNKEDLLEIQALLDHYRSPIKILSKIENREGVKNIQEILDHSFGVMIARGDLGIELPAEEVPLVQKKLIKACIQRAKTVITATQMMHSMIKNPRPTRAEVSDVANAILDGTDAIMLSGETAYGKYPVEAVSMMSAIARKVEKKVKKQTKSKILQALDPIRFQLIKCAINSAKVLPAQALIVHTNSGRSARLLSAYRCKTPIKALCRDEETVRWLALTYGIQAFSLDYNPNIDDMIFKTCDLLLRKTKLKKDDLIIMVADVPGQASSTNFLEVATLSQIEKRVE